MKNKKALSPLGIIGSAILVLVLVWVVNSGLIQGIFVDKQIAFAGSKTEEITIDCDADGSLGPLDQCPCDPNTKKLYETQKCGTAADISIENCPALCEK